VAFAGHKPCDGPLVLKIIGTDLQGNAKKTKSWLDYQTLALGKIRVEAGGPQKLILHAGPPESWKPLNVREIRLRVVD
jgi:hypothetical protein